jgi:hypothetical protein
VTFADTLSPWYTEAISEALAGRVSP